MGFSALGQLPDSFGDDSRSNDPPGDPLPGPNQHLQRHHQQLAQRRRPLFNIRLARRLHSLCLRSTVGLHDSAAAETQPNQGTLPKLAAQS